jgi:enoyl-CoA hydratase/carnithine racemase
MSDVKVEKKEHVAVVTIEHMQAMNALSTDMYSSWRRPSKRSRTWMMSTVSS